MSFLFKKVAAQDANGDEVIAKRNGYSLVYNPVNNGYWFYTRNGEGIGLPRVANKQAAMIEFNRLVDGAQDSCGKDTAEPKVGEKVYWGLSNGIVTSINGNEVTVKTQNGREEKVFVEAIHGIDPKGSFDNSAMDDLNDGIKTIENKARALIADAKNARSKYAEILARSEIAKNNAQVKKTFEDDIARCDKLINALKAI